MGEGSVIRDAPRKVQWDPRSLLSAFWPPQGEQVFCTMCSPPWCSASLQAQGTSFLQTVLTPCLGYMPVEQDLISQYRLRFKSWLCRLSAEWAPVCSFPC